MNFLKNSIEEARLHTARTISDGGNTLYMSTNSEKHTPDTTLVCVGRNGTVRAWASRATLGDNPKIQAAHIEAYLENLRGFVFDDGVALPIIASRVPGQHGRKWSDSKRMEFVTDKVHKTPETLAAREKIMSALNADVVRATGSLKRASPSLHDYNVMIENPDFARSVIDIYNRHPWLAMHVEERMLFLGLSNRKHRWQDVFKLHPDDAVRYIIEKGFTNIEVGSTVYERQGECMTSGVRAMVNIPALSFHYPSEAGNFIRFLSSIPLSWARDWCQPENLNTAMNVMLVVSKLTVSETPDAVTRLLAGSRGNLNHVADILGEKLESRHAGTDLRDCIVSFRTDVINPLVRVAFEGSRINQTKQKNIGNELIRRMLGFEGLGRLVEISEKWHRMEEEIRHRKNAGNNNLSWPPLAENYKASNGLMLIPLYTAKQLADEGSRQRDDDGMLGLNHCVGSYDAYCRSGSSHIVSVRKRNGRQWERVSTVEYALNVANGGSLTERQHRAQGNGNPTAEAIAAVNEWTNLVQKKKISLNIDDIVRNMNEVAAENPTDPMEKLARGLLAWQPLLKGEYRQMTAEDLVMHAFEFDERRDSIEQRPNRMTM